MDPKPPPKANQLGKANLPLGQPKYMEKIPLISPGDKEKVNQIDQNQKGLSIAVHGQAAGIQASNKEADTPMMYTPTALSSKDQEAFREEVARTDITVYMTEGTIEVTKCSFAEADHPHLVVEKGTSSREGTKKLKMRKPKNQDKAGKDVKEAQVPI